MNHQIKTYQRLRLLAISLMIPLLLIGSGSGVAQTIPGNGGYSDLATQRQNFLNHINNIRKNNLQYRRNVSGLVAKVRALHFPEEVYLDQYATVDGQNKLPDYQSHDQLNNAAQWMAVELANRGGPPTHDATWNTSMFSADDRAKHYGWTGGKTEEAISHGSSNLNSEAASEGWLQSTTHFRPFFWKDGQVYSHVGFGIATSQHGTYAVALFGNPGNVRPNFPKELAIDACDCEIVGAGVKAPWEVAAKLVIGKNLDNVEIDAANAISNAPNYLDPAKQGKLIADDTWMNTIYWDAADLPDISKTGTLTTAQYDGKKYDVYHADFMKPVSGGFSGSKLMIYDGIARPKNTSGVFSNTPAALQNLTLNKFVTAINTGAGGTTVKSKTISIKMDCKGRTKIVTRPPLNPANNVAKNKPAIQSSDDAGGVASRAADGDKNGAFSNGSVTHTKSESNPFWWIDLGQSYAIEEIRVYGRSDCCQDRLNNYILVVTDTKPEGNALLAGAQRGDLVNNDPNLANTKVFRSKKSFGIGSAMEAWTPVNLHKTSGQYIFVMAPGANRVLSLAEVEVFKTP